jgi:DHA3 family macrolide efflux protein-like MFS transporter
MILTSDKRSLKPFILLELANFSGFFSASMVFLLYPWLSLNVTGSSASAGLVIAVTSIPGLLMSPLIGSLIDKFGRRRFAYISEWLTMLTSLAVPIVALLAKIDLFSLIVIGLVRSIMGFGGPSARKSLVPDVAERGGITLERANSIHESVAAAGFATGPAIAALLLSSMSEIDTFYVVAAVGALSGIFVWLIRVTEKHEEHDSSADGSFIRYATQGFRTLAGTPSVLIVMSAFLTLALIYIPIEMLVLPRYFNSSDNPAGLGFLLTAMAASTSISSLLFEAFTKIFRFSTILRIGLMGVAVPVLLMAFLPDYFWMILLGLVLGFAWGPLSPLLNTVIQRKVPANERGRVFSLEMTIWSGGPMLSMVVVGLAIDAFPLQAVYIALGLLTLATALLISLNRRTPELNTAEFHD